MQAQTTQTSFFPGDITPPQFLRGEGRAGTELYPFQQKAIHGIRTSLLVGNKRVVLKSPTGSGKTILASHIIQGALGKNNRVIFVVDAISLIDQTVRKFWRHGIEAIGVIQAQHEMTDNSQPVQVCSVQTLRNRWIPPADLVIIDEVHTWHKFYQKWMEKPEWRETPFIGLSATPYTRGLGKYFEDLIISCSTLELISMGFLSPFRVFRSDKPDLKDVQTTGGDYNLKQLARALNRKELVAKAAETWLKSGEDRPTLCYGVDRAHANSLKEEFLSQGVTAAYMDAYTEPEERREIEEKSRTGEIKVVCNIGVLTKGIDWPWISCISLCRSTKSEMLYQQIIGRGLRMSKKTGKTDCIILDHSDSTYNLGLVTDIDEQHDTLDMGKKGGSSTNKKKMPVECPGCGYLKDHGVYECPVCGHKPMHNCSSCGKEKPTNVHECPHCGFKPVKQTDVIHLDGELKEVAGKKKKYTIDEKKEFFAELKHYYETNLKEKGVKSGWAACNYKNKFGAFPNHPSIRYVEPKEPSQNTLNWLKSQLIRYKKRREK